MQRKIGIHDDMQIKYNNDFITLGCGHGLDMNEWKQLLIKSVANTGCKCVFTTCPMF